MQSKFWRLHKSRDQQFTAKPRFPRVAAKAVLIGNKPAGSYWTRYAGFVVLPDRLEGKR